jgi:hypothetical protein
MGVSPSVRDGVADPKLSAHGDVTETTAST